MQRYVVPLRGSGRVEVVAYGMADAEHLVEKEILQRWPTASVEVVGIARVPGSGRIAEEFSADYRVRADVEVDAENAEAARRLALRRLHDALAGTRYHRIEWAK